MEDMMWMISEYESKKSSYENYWNNYWIKYNKK
jgi:hypothetical protein